MKQKFIHFMLLIVTICATMVTKSQTFSLLTTMNTNREGSHPANFLTIGSTTYFTIINTNSNTDELWKTDGTNAGTAFIKSFAKTTDGIYHLTNLNGVLFFAANDGVNGAELWKSNGTTAGTVLVKDIYPGSQSGMLKGPLNPGSILAYKPIVIGTTMYFIGTQDINISGTEVWKTDGTTAGTELIKDVNTAPIGQIIGELTNINGTLFYMEYTVDGNNIYKTNGTAAGTVKVGATNSAAQFYSLINYNNTLFCLSSSTSSAAAKLFKCNATATDLVEVTTLLANPASSLTLANNLLFFPLQTASEGLELWKSDGTAAGTVLLKDIYSGTASSGPMHIVTVGSTLFFTANQASTGRELWKSDGTTAGTVMVKDVFAGPISLMPESTIPLALYNVNNTLYFAADDGTNGVELWKSDGTAAGTVMVKDISSGGYGSFPSNIAYAYGSNIFFAATDNLTGFELWKTDGTATGTELVKDILTTNDPFETSIYSTGNLFKVNETGGNIYITGFERKNGAEPYITDGTIAGTIPVKDIYPGNHPSNASGYTNLNGINIFAATTELGRELWKTDGTLAGTMMVKDIFPGAGSSFPGSFIKLGNNVFFAATDSLHGIELWKTDGTAAGTLMVKDINPGVANGGAGIMTLFNNKLFFSANNGINGQELWVTDGTEAGTYLFKEFNTNNPNGIGVSTNFPPLVIGNTMFITGVSSPTDAELWKSDGTPAGTVLVKDIVAGTDASFPQQFANLNGTLLFIARYPAYNSDFKLMKSDGTAAGTVLVKDIPARLGSTAVLNNNLFFSTATSSSSATELWKTDGTEAGTVLVKDINPGAGYSAPFGFLTIGQWVYFFANDGTSTALWKTDGTELGTIKVTEFEAGGISSSLGGLFLVGNTLYAAVNTKTYGTELWTTNVSSILPIGKLELFATLKNKEVTINWQATHEVNLQHYHVQRSLDGIHFSTIGTVAAKGGGKYDFLDSHLPNAINKVYYRLESVEKDGRNAISQMVNIKLDPLSHFSIYPNPASNTILVQATNAIHVSIIDMVGRTVARSTMGNTSTIQMDLSQMPKGMYSVVLTNMDGTTATQKLVLQ